MISISEGAVAEAKRLMDEQKLEGYVLRVGVQGGGCSGLSYTLGFDNSVNESDHVVEEDGIKLVCDNKSMLYLNDSTLEYVKDLMGGGFKFNNPSAKSTCGCGSSFS